MTLTATPDVVPVLVGMLLSGIGVGLTIPTLMGVALGSLPPSSFATGSGVINMVRQAFMAIGVAVLVAIVGAPVGIGARVDAFHRGWWILALVTIVGLLPTLLRLHTRQPEPGPSARSTIHASAE